MSRASDYATRFKQAVEVERAAERAKDSITPVRLVLPPEVVNPDALWNQQAQSPKTERVIAYATTEGRFAFEKTQGPLLPEDALKLARWILETFGDPDADQIPGFHAIDCTIWKRTKGDCTCGGHTLKTPGAL